MAIKNLMLETVCRSNTEIRANNVANMNSIKFRRRGSYINSRAENLTKTMALEKKIKNCILDLFLTFLYTNLIIY